MIPTLAIGGAGRRMRTFPALGQVAAMMDPSAADNVTSITDALGNTYAASGSAVTDTGVSGFGGTAVYIPPGGGNYFTATDDARLQILSGGDFTIEAFVRLNALPAGSYGVELVTQSGSAGYQFRMGASALECVFPGAAIAAARAVTWATGQTYHVAWSRAGSTHYAAIDGAVTSGTGGNVTADATPNLIIGNVYDVADAWISWRLTRGLARYTSAYTPPAAPFF